jgi:hypothetical protein
MAPSYRPRGGRVRLLVVLVGPTCRTVVSDNWTRHLCSFFLSFFLMGTCVLNVPNSSSGGKKLSM